MTRPKPILLSVAQMAELFNVQPKTIHTWRERGRVTATQPGGRHSLVQFTVAEARRLLCADGAMSEGEADALIREHFSLPAERSEPVSVAS